MNLQQILSEVKTLVPPSEDITDDMLVLKINQIQRRVYRELVIPDKVKAFQSTPGIPYYDLPSDCGEDRIRNVLVDNIEYPVISNQEKTAPDRLSSVWMNKLYIYPNPTNAVNVFLYYRPRYHDLSINNMADVPDLPEDYHELLVFGCAQWIAQIQRDTDIANNLQGEFDNLLRDAKKHFRQATSKRVRNVEGW